MTINSPIYDVCEIKILLFQWIWEDNRQYLRDLNLFEHSYFKLVEKSTFTIAVLLSFWHCCIVVFLALLYCCLFGIAVCLCVCAYVILV